jgi:hypothetical protein
MLFTENMIYNPIDLMKCAVTLTILLCMISCVPEPNDNFSDSVKVALRDVGHRLLLSNRDSTSLVKPVVALSDDKFQLSFENELSIHPDTLVDRIRYSLEKAGLPSFYFTEVVQCADGQVSYSYEMKQDVEKGIIPCAGRNLKKGCYLITVRFTQRSKATSKDYLLFYILGLVGLGLLWWVLYRRKTKLLQKTLEQNDANYASLGAYRFYPEQNMLIKEATEISLSKKECELLAIFVAHPNQIVKREELTKKVWEDNGVIVGRSLDTYISKLRNKLKDDTSIQIINIHGVGYKLEMN